MYSSISSYFRLCSVHFDYVQLFYSPFATIIIKALFASGYLCVIKKKKKSRFMYFFLFSYVLILVSSYHFIQNGHETHVVISIKQKNVRSFDVIRYVRPFVGTWEIICLTTEKNNNKNSSWIFKTSVNRFQA